MMHFRNSLFAISAAILLTAGLAFTVGVGAASAATTPTATTGHVTSAMPTSSMVTGTVNPNGTATTYYFEYGPSTGTTYPSKTGATSAGAGTTDVGVTATLTGLTPDTSYQYRIVATSSLGTTDGGTGVLNTTQAPVVTTGDVSKLATSSATLNGTINPEGVAASWYFQYGLSTAYGTKTPVMNLAASSNYSNVSVAISGLAPHSTYHYQLVVTSTAGTTLGADGTLATGLSVTITTNTWTPTYGQFVLLSGTVASGVTGQMITLSAEKFNQTTFTPITKSLKSRKGGTWRIYEKPLARTTYEVTSAGGTSQPIVISVRPAVYMTIASSGKISARVAPAGIFEGKVLQLQVLIQGSWVEWKHVRLNSVGKTTFTTLLNSKVSGARPIVRMAIGVNASGIDQAAPGFLEGFSRSQKYNLHVQS